MKNYHFSDLEEGPMSEEQQAIERDMDIAEMKTKAWVLIAVFAFVAVALLWYGAAHAQTLIAPTRIGPADWQCLDASGAVLSNHQRFDTAFVACYNNAQGAEIVGGRYRIARVTAPPEPCPAQPADDTRDGACPTGTTGSWQQTRTYASAAAPICWQAGEWLPASPPAGSCESPPPTLTAPTLATPTHEAGTNADRYNVILSWSEVPGATSYRVNRCVGPNCSTMSVHAANVTGTTYKNTNIPANTYKYQVEARRGTEIGPASNLAVYAVTATPPPPPPPPDPPPTGTGTASLTWERPTTNTDGSQLTDLAGYRIVYGTSASTLGKTVQIANPAVSTYTLDDLGAGTWFFAVRAYTSGGLESANSNVASKVVP